MTRIDASNNGPERAGKPVKTGKVKKTKVQTQSQKPQSAAPAQQGSSDVQALRREVEIKEGEIGKLQEEATQGHTDADKAAKSAEDASADVKAAQQGEQKAAADLATADKGVQTAQQELKKAQTPEEKKAAEENLQAALDKQKEAQEKQKQAAANLQSAQDKEKEASSAAAASADVAKQNDTKVEEQQSQLNEINERLKKAEQDLKQTGNALQPAEVDRGEVVIDDIDSFEDFADTSFVIGADTEFTSSSISANRNGFSGKSSFHGQVGETDVELRRQLDVGKNGTGTTTAINLSKDKNSLDVGVRSDSNGEQFFAKGTLQTDSTLITAKGTYRPDKQEYTADASLVHVNSDGSSSFGVSAHAEGTAGGEHTQQVNARVRGQNFGASASVRTTESPNNGTSLDAAGQISYSSSEEQAKIQAYYRSGGNYGADATYGRRVIPGLDIGVGAGFDITGTGKTTGSLDAMAKKALSDDTNLYGAFQVRYENGELVGKGTAGAEYQFLPGLPSAYVEVSQDTNGNSQVFGGLRGTFGGDTTHHTRHRKP
ncbi:hypothetical protein IJG72_06925 [bacterium]|nr:hypothetical protein [bacterium]